ncbi:MAG TPA: NUDIX hydrolase [Acidimicrobiales bacterium]|nr:NUDIX hydrolase [Acidimicrobiales bacterium]
MARFSRAGEEVRYTGPLISVATGTYRAPDGSSFERDVVHHPGAVSVVPVVEDGAADAPAVLLVRQYRSAVDRELLEIPAGKRDVAGEDPATTAERELAEEVGMRAGEITRLAEFFNSPGFCDEHSFVFMARAMEACGIDAQGIEEEHMTVERVALAEVPGLIAEGRIVDAKTIIGLCLARETLAGTVRP